MRRATLAVCLAFSLSTAATAAEREYDDCDSGFIAFQGSDTYQFSPRLAGELGRVRLFSLFSFQEAAAFEEWGTVFWHLEVRAVKPEEREGAGRLVHRAEGSARIVDAHGAVQVETLWNGRDLAGKVVPSGKYHYSFLGTFVPDRSIARPVSFDTARGAEGAVAAQSSIDTVIVDFNLDAASSQALRASARLGACPVKQNSPLEAGFGYNFYYGSTHSHSNWSDGGQPTSGCSSGNAYGSGNFDPTAVFNYAKTTAGVDFWVVNEHNHLIQDAIATNDPPVTEAKVRARYAAGRAAANAVTVDDQFVGIYGMEWGVSTNTDQGHVTLLETPTLFGWESCTTCNGPNIECTPGSNCYFDVFTPKRFGYLTLYQRSVENPSSAGALGIFCHPGSGNFDNFAFNAAADEAMQGIAVRSGLAFNLAASCADANVGSTDYSARWREALDKGFHLGPVADHDTHCNNYGDGIPNRTVYLLPNGSVPTLTKPAVLAAHKARHFYATEDSNAQLVFTTSDGHMLGDIYTANGAVTLRAALYDPDGDSISTLEVWRDQIGGGLPTAPYRTISGSSTLTFTETLSSGSYYYYVHAVQADGHDLWSSPIWITYAPVCNETDSPVVTVQAPAEGAAFLCADTTVEVSATDPSGIASVEVQIDGGAWNAATFNSGSGRWTYAWASSGASTGAHTIVARATDASCGANLGTSATRNVTTDNSACGLVIGGYRVAQANSTINYTIPAGTRIPNGGYVILGRDATKTAFEAFWRGGTPLPANVVYINTAGSMPQINGSENYTLFNAAGTTIDARSVSMAAGANQSIQRKDPCNTPGQTASWSFLAASAATPGSGAGAGCNTGKVVINEFADAAGTGNFIYEFVELHYDR